MNLERHTTRQLHQEHETTFDLCARLERTVTGPGWPPADRDATALGALRSIESMIAQEVMRHFDFEEKSLFPLLEQQGERDIAAILREDHDTIRACAAELTELLGRAQVGELDRAGWTTLAIMARELAERLVVHGQKEEMALLPALDDLLDEETDRSLLDAYLSG